MSYVMLPIGGGQFLIYEEEAAAAALINPGRPLRRSTGASLEGGTGCGMGKRRK